MPAKHATRGRYLAGCRCDECKHAQALYQRRYRERKLNGETRPAAVVAELPQAEPVTPGPVESAVNVEIGGYAAEARPGLAQVALALARIMDNPRAINQQPTAAKVLAAMLEKLHSTSARSRRGGLALVRTMTEKGGA